jgi:flagellar capping protein FliD
MVTTTGVDSTATASSTAATKSSIGSSILLTLGSGSGINVQELATNLTNAEKLPAEYALQGKIDKTEAKISGYGLISSQLDILASSFEKINDANEIYSTAGKSSNENAVSFLSVTNDAPEGGYDINVYQLAENQRVASNSYQTSSGNVNASAAFDITLSIGVTRTGTYEHSIATAQLQAVGDGTSAYIEYSDGSNTIQITQAEIDIAMESLEGAGIYTFENASLEGLILAINNDISANAGFAGNFSSAEAHRTKGISFVQTTAGASAQIASAIASVDGSASYSIGNIAQGIISAAPVNGSPASYTFTPSSAGSDSLAVSDGTTTVSIASTDFSVRTDYELSITEAQLQTALASTGSISVAGSNGSGSDETVTVGLADMTTFGLPIPLGALTLQDLANAINSNASTNFQTTAVVDDNKLTFVQKANAIGTITSATRSDTGATITKTNVSVTSAQQMAEAIQDASDYDNLKFTVSATSTSLVFDYKSDGVVSTPTFTLNGSAQTASSSVLGVNSVNAPTDTIVKIGAGNDTLAGIVTAINDADTGITAALLDVSGIGNDYRIVLSGAEGLDGRFSVATSSSVATNSLGFDVSSNVLQAAQDAEIGYEGLLINRGSNVISDVIEGTTFQLNSTTRRVTSVPHMVLSNGSGTGTDTGYAYDISQENVNTVRFTPKAAYVGQNLGAGPTGGPGSGYTATTIANPYGSDPANITVYDVSPLNNSDIDNYLDDSADPDYLGSVTLYDGIGGSMVLPRNGLGGFWPNGTTTADGETIERYVATAQAASFAAGTGSATTGGTDDTYTDYTGGTINSVNSGSYEYGYTEAQLRADVAASIITTGGSGDGDGALIFTDDYGRDHNILASEIRTLSGGTSSTSTRLISITNPSFESQSLSNYGYTSSVITGWTVNTSGGDSGAYNPGEAPVEATTTGSNTAYLYSDGATVSQVLGETYNSASTYQFKLDIGDLNYYDHQPDANYTIKLYAGSTEIGTVSGTSDIDALTEVTLNSSVSNSALNGQALKIEVTKNSGEELLIDNVRGTVTEVDNGTGTFTLSLSNSDLASALNTNKNASGNTYVSITDGSGHTLMIEANQNDNGGTNFSSYWRNILTADLQNATVQAGSTPATSDYDDFDFTISQSADGTLIFTPKQGVTDPTVTSVLVSSATSPVWSTANESTVNFAYTNAQLQTDMLRGAIHGNYPNQTDDHSYISFTDTNGNTIMVSRDDGSGAELKDRSDYGGDGDETIKNLAETLQVATAVSGSDPATSSYSDFDYTVGYDGNGLIFTLKDGRSLGSGTFEARRSGASSTNQDGEEWETTGTSGAHGGPGDVYPYGSTLGGTATSGSAALGSLAETQNGAPGTETLAGLIAAIQADQDYPANLGSNNNGVGGDNGAADDLRFTVALSGTGQGIVFTPQGTPRNPDSGMAMFSAKRTSSSSTSLYNLSNLGNLTGATGGSYTALQSTPTTPGSGNYSNTGTINSTVGTTGGGTFRIAWSDAQLQADLLSGRIENYADSDSIDDRAYISFTDNDGDTIMVERSTIGTAGSETIAGLVTALQGATAGTNSNGFARHAYADFDYTISSDSSGLILTPKTSPAIGDSLSLQMRRSRNDSEYTSSNNDGATFATEQPLRHTIIEDRGLIPGTPGTPSTPSGPTYLTKYRTETVFDSARLTITRDKSQLKTNLQDIITSYNDLESLIDELNTDEAVEAGLSLAGEGSLLRSVQSRIYNALTASSSTASGTVDAVRDLGISVDRYGKLQFDEAKYDTLIATNWDDVVTMLTADTTNQSLFGLAPKGLGQDVATIINGLSASTLDGDVQNGLIANRTAALTKNEESYQAELTKLEARMAVLYQRYLTQFTAMETLMNSLNNTRDYMKSQIDVITSAYDKN